MYDTEIVVDFSYVDVTNVTDQSRNVLRIRLSLYRFKISIGGRRSRYEGTLS